MQRGSWKQPRPWPKIPEQGLTTVHRLKRRGGLEQPRTDGVTMTKIPEQGLTTVHRLRRRGGLEQPRMDGVTMTKIAEQGLTTVHRLKRRGGIGSVGIGCRLRPTRTHVCFVWCGSVAHGGKSNSLDWAKCVRAAVLLLLWVAKCIIVFKLRVVITTLAEQQIGVCIRLLVPSANGLL